MAPTQNIIKPPPLFPGDTIGIVAPSSLPQELQHIEEGIACVEALGFNVLKGSHRWTPQGYLAGSDTERVYELNAMFGNPDVKALFTIRGGYGAMRLLPHINYNVVRQNPKLLIGYSDITALHLALYKYAGVTSISGPVLVEWRNEHPDSVQHALHLANGAVFSPLENLNQAPLIPLRPGITEGPLIGGNLAMVTRLLGTPFFPDLTGALLFLEDVGERVYRIDAMLSQLKLAGVFEQVAGIVLGQFTGGIEPPGRRSLSLHAVFEHFFAASTYPVVTGLQYGHIFPRISIPFGSRVRLDATGIHAQLDMLEPVVAKVSS